MKTIEFLCLSAMVLLIALATSGLFGDTLAYAQHIADLIMGTMPAPPDAKFIPRQVK